MVPMVMVLDARPLPNTRARSRHSSMPPPFLIVVERHPPNEKKKKKRCSQHFHKISISRDDPGAGGTGGGEAREEVERERDMTAGNLDDAIKKIDGLLIDMEKEAEKSGVETPVIRFDPDDPWASDRSLPPSYVVKKRCPKTGYLMTKPFESQCPMPEAFVKDNAYLRGMLKPVVKPANAAAAQAPSTSSGQQESGGKAKAASAGGAATVEDFGKVLFKVAMVTSVECHPDSEKLYICQLDIGNGETKQVVAGLQKYVKVEDLQGKLVVCVANLKKAKLAGTPSEAMILAAESKSADGVDGIVVRTLVPPAGAAPGDIVFLEGTQPAEKFTKRLSSTIWGNVGKALSVKGGVACFMAHAFCVQAGKITVEAPDGTTIK